MPGSSTPARERFNRRQLGVVFDLLIGFYRDLMVLSLGGPEAEIVHTDRRTELASSAATAGNRRWMAALEDLLLARRRLDQNANPRLLTDWLAVRLVDNN